MDRIRNTMMLHEALFKQQVQALHHLYQVQKSVMQEINIQIPPHASGFDGQPTIKPAYDAVGLANRVDSLALTLSPFPIFKKMRRLVPLTNVPLRNFDLEKLPEECMQESEIIIAASNTSILVNAFSKDPITDEISSAGAGQDDDKRMDSHCLKHIFSEINSRKICQTTERVSEGKEHGIDKNNSMVASNSSSKIIEMATSDKSSEFFPATATNTGVHSNSSHTSNACKENPISCQDSENIPEQDEGIIHQREPKEPDNFSTIDSDHSTNKAATGRSSYNFGVAKESTENAKQRHELQEACETVAAKILLSFAPSKSSKPDRDTVNIVEKTQNLRQRKDTDYTSNGGIADPFKWAKKSSRRRSSRRAR
ncbi:hypothetical protein ACFE04_012032 [Oxalis oulophora]